MIRRYAPHFTTLRVVSLLYVAIAVSLLGHKPLWLDEIWQQLGTRNVSFHQMVAYARDNAGGALLPHLLQWCVLKGLPYSAAASRIPALLFGIGSVVLSWCLARQVRVKHPLVVAVLIMALPILFRYTLEARPYSEGVFFCCWALLLLFQLDERPTVARSLTLCLVVAAGLYSQPFVIFELLVVAVVLAGTSWKKALYLVLPAVGSVLLYLPWYLAASREWSNGLTASGGVAVFDAKLPLRVLREFTGGGYLVGLCFLLLIALGLRVAGRQRLKYILAAGFFAGLLLPLLAEQHLQYFYAARHLIFALPAGALLCGLAFESTAKNSLIVARAALGVLLIASVATVAVKEVGPHENWQTVAERLETLTANGECVQSIRPDGMTYYHFFEPSLPEGNCVVENRRHLVMVKDPYTPESLLKAKIQTLESRGYEEERRENVNAFRLVYFLLRGNQAFANGK